MRQQAHSKWGGVAAALALMLAGLASGCGQGSTVSPLSPTVSAESEAGLKARAQDQQLREERQRQEAALHRRNPKLPGGE